MMKNVSLIYTIEGKLLMKLNKVTWSDEFELLTSEREKEYKVKLIVIVNHYYMWSN